MAPSAELFDVPLEQPFGAIRAEAVRKISFRVLVDIGFQLRPVPLVIPDLLAARTDGKQAAQDLDAIDRMLQFRSALTNALFQKVTRLFQVLFNLLPFCDLGFQLCDEMPVADFQYQQRQSSPMPTPRDFDHQNEEQAHHAAHGDVEWAAFAKQPDHQG